MQIMQTLKLYKMILYKFQNQSTSKKAAQRAPDGRSQNGP